MMKLLNSLTGYHRVPDLFLLGITVWLIIGYFVCFDISRSIAKKDSSQLKANALFVIFSIWVGIFFGLRYGHSRSYTDLAIHINLVFMLVYPLALFGVAYNTRPSLTVWCFGYVVFAVCTLFMPGMRGNSAFWGRVCACGLVLVCYVLTYLVVWLIRRPKGSKKEDK